MPRTAIAVQTIGFQSGTTISYAAADATNGMLFPNNGQTVLVVKNASAGSINVTVKAVADEAGRSVDLVQAVAAGADAIIGPLRPAWWNQRSADLDKVYVDFSAAASVSVAALKLQP
ncbi:Uncharacterised protein [Mycobacterium tuberculosis]|nr:Uncharacterised protein [Mycobacterium tuberculosis]